MPLPAQHKPTRKVGYRIGDSIILSHTPFAGIHKEQYPDSLSGQLMNGPAAQSPLSSRLDKLAEIVLASPYAQEKPDDTCIVVQLRIGDVLQNSPYTVEQHLVHPPKSERVQTKRGRYLGRYTKSLCYYGQAIDEILSEHKITRCVVTAGGTPPLTEISREYIDTVMAFIRTRIPDTVLRTQTLCDRCNWKQADSDFAYLCFAKHLIVSGGGFANLARSVNKRIKQLLAEDS